MIHDSGSEASAERKGNGCKNRNVKEEELVETFKAGAECIAVKETGFVREQMLKQKA